jgi:tRNA-uridine 2-sulfurtransferase
LVKALGLLSGGLDSCLAVKLMLDQGIEVEALSFVTPFSSDNSETDSNAVTASRLFDIPLKIVSADDDYLQMIRHPRFGYGSGMNPCIDCRIFMLLEAKRRAEEIGAAFIFTGEVLEQRPKSQHRKAFKLIDHEAGLEGRVLRPLSAKLLPRTEAERTGLVDRKKLLAVNGRSRKKQMILAEKWGITDYPHPAGGCSLTRKEFARKVHKLLRYKEDVTQRDIQLLRAGRHYWKNGNHIIVGRNESDNDTLLELKNPEDALLEVPDCPSPVTLLEGDKTGAAVETAARLTAKYSDAASGRVAVEYRSGGLIKYINVERE